MSEDLTKYADEKNLMSVFPGNAIFRIAYDASTNMMQIACRSFNVENNLRHTFSVANQSAFFVERYGFKAEARLYAINKFGLFKPGLVWEILKWIKQEYGSLSVLVMSDKCKAYINEQLLPLKSFVNSLDKDNWIAANIADDTGRNAERRREGKPTYEYRDYQAESIKQLLFKGFGKGLIEIPTAGGKSFILANFCWNLHKQYDRNLKYLILVPTKQLVSQMHSDFIDYGYDKHVVTMFTAGLKGNNKFNPDAKIIVANRQYIFNNADKLPKVDVLICDEAHTCLANKTVDFIEAINCKIKIGCSGTLPRDKYGKWQILGMFSRIVYTEDITDLQEKGYIANLKITSLKIIDSYVESNTNLLFNLHTDRKYRPDEYGYSEIAFDDANKAEHEYFAKHYKELYKPVFEYLFKLKENTLILFDRVEIGQNLFEYAKELYTGQKNVFYIDGSIPVEIRENIRVDFEKSDGNLLLAQSATFSTGVNIRRLTNLVFLTSSKSFSRVLQSIGRTLRLHESKNEAHLIDVHWEYKYSKKHYDDRLSIYKNAYGLRPYEQLTFTI